MRTYWLIGQTSEQKQHLQNSLVLLNEAAPDLISNVDTESFTSSPAALPILNHCYLKHMQRGTTTCSSNTANQQQQQRQQRYVKTSYCSCETKCIYNRRSDDNVTVDTIPQWKHQMDRTNAVCNNSYLCVCRLNSSVLHTTNTHRGPRSAPVITFRL